MLLLYRAGSGFALISARGTPVTGEMNGWMSGRIALNPQNKLLDYCLGPRMPLGSAVQTGVPQAPEFPHGPVRLTGQTGQALAPHGQ